MFRHMHPSLAAVPAPADPVAPATAHAGAVLQSHDEPDPGAAARQPDRDRAPEPLAPDQPGAPAVDLDREPLDLRGPAHADAQRPVAEAAPAARQLEQLG